MSKDHYGILTKVSIKNIPIGKSIRDAEYILTEDRLSEERGKEFMETAQKDNKNAGWKEVKVVYSPPTVGTTYFWVKAFILTDETAIATSASIRKGIENFFRQQTIDILSEDRPEVYVDKMMQVYDAGIKAMKQEGEKQFGTPKDITDGEVEQGSDLDSILNDIESKMKNDSDDN